MKSAKWLGAVLAICVSLGAAHAQDLTSIATEDLINKLQDESNQRFGNDQAYGFMAINEEAKFNRLTLGSAKPVISPVMRELVRRGAVALPMLIGHLSDARPTKVTAYPRFLKCFANEYDPRHRERPTIQARVMEMPPGVVEPMIADLGSKRLFSHYTVKVGDLCYLAVGQIVNRHLNPVQYWPSMCFIINSPVETPALAAAVKADWGGLTPAAHRKSLEKDALQPRVEVILQLWMVGNSRAEALKRLMFYYPKAGVDTAVHLLNSPLDDGYGIDFGSIQDIVDALAAFPSETIDEAVYGLLKRVSETHPTDMESNNERCELVHACAYRLTKPGDRGAFEESYREVMATSPKPPKPATMEAEFAELDPAKPRKAPKSAAMTAFSKRFQAYLNDEIGTLAPQ